MYTNWVFDLKGTIHSTRMNRSYLLLPGLGSLDVRSVVECLRFRRASLEQSILGRTLDQIRLTVGLDLGACQAVGNAVTSQNVVDAVIGLDHDLRRLLRRAVHSQDQRLPVAADLALDKGGHADLGEGVLLQPPEPTRLIVFLGLLSKDANQVALLRHAIGLLLAVGQSQKKCAELGELGQEGPDLHATLPDAHLAHCIERDLDGSLEGESRGAGGTGGGLYDNGLVHSVFPFLGFADTLLQKYYTNNIYENFTLSQLIRFYSNLYTLFF